MQFWDNIVHTALLGTDKRQLKKEDISPNLVEVYELINQINDKEEQYLNFAAVAFNYRRCGALPLNKSIIYSNAKDDVQVYCSLFAQQVLNDIVSIENYPLLELWLQKCNNSDQIVQPECIPLLFDVAVKYKPLQPQISVVTGKRGEWLLPLNEA